MVDQTVFNNMIQEKLPRIAKKFRDLEVDMSMFTMQWFACIFAYNVP